MPGMFLLWIEPEKNKSSNAVNYNQQDCMNPGVHGNYGFLYFLKVKEAVILHNNSHLTYNGILALLINDKVSQNTTQY